MKIVIINPIETHLLSSPSYCSKRKVAKVPADSARTIRNQNNVLSLRLVPSLSTSLTTGSEEGSLFSDSFGSGFSGSFLWHI